MSEFKIEKKWIYVIALILILTFVMGFWTFKIGKEEVTGQVYELDGVTYTDYWAYVAAYQAKYGKAPPEPVPDETPRDAAKLQFSLQNAITMASVSGSTTTVDVVAVNDGVVDFLTKREAITVDSAPEQGALFYSEGQTLIFHVLSDTEVSDTYGEDYYDRWYWVTIAEGADIHVFTPSCVSVKTTSPYTYSWVGGGEVTGFKVQYTAGTTPYWDLGVMYLYGRVDKVYLDIFVTQGGTTLSTVADGAAWDDTDAEVNANHTMTSTSEDIYFKLVSGYADYAFGLPMYTLSQAGQLQERRAVMMFTTAMTSIGTGVLYDEGWLQISKSDLYNEVGYYKVLDPMIPSRGNTFDVSVKIPIDASAAASSTEFRFAFWVHDFQMPAYVASGSPSTSVPTAYGFLSEFGLDSVIHAHTLTVSSGTSATMQMMTYITTP